MTTSTDVTTVSVTLFRPVTFTVARFLDSTSDPATVDDTLDVWHFLASSAKDALAYDRDTFAVFATAIAESGAVIVRYEHDDEVTARCLFPTRLFISKENHVSVRAWCSVRQQVRTFRCDRCACVHALALPGEVAPAPAA